MSRTAYLMKNTVQAYDWGHPDFIKDFLGGGADIPEPQAELWMGSHPKAPSILETPRGNFALDRLIAENPREYLGQPALDAGWTDLPFLFKVLAAGKPLSIQCHPSLSAAREGFDRENSLGIPMGASHRNYKDPNHKPEIICAMTEFWGMSGFRPRPDMVADLEALARTASPAFRPLVEGLSKLAEKGDFKGLVKAVLELRDRQEALAAELRNAFRERKEDRFVLMIEADQVFPGDIGLIFFLVLNLVKLAPGEGIFIPAGVLHAYVKGIGIEVMANSDNVLRGGLTPKHIDIPQLMANLDPSIPVEVLKPSRGGSTTEYSAPVPEFRLQRIKSKGRVELDAKGSPEILLCMEGCATLETGNGTSLAIPKGRSAYVLPGKEKISLDLDGEVCRVFIPL